MIPCIIPARGGSKSIPQKNVREFRGKPLIAWSIEQADAAELVDEVWVTTDSQAIAKVADTLGAKVHCRSKASATDDAPSEMAIVEWMRQCGMNDCEAIVFLQATSPIRPKHDIDECIRLVTRDGFDSAFSCRRVEGYVWKQGEGVLSPQYVRRLPRQQQTVHTLEENGSIYVFQPQVVLTTGQRLGGKIAAYEQHPLDSFQIDEPDDWELLERIAEVRNGNQHATASV